MKNEIELKEISKSDSEAIVQLSLQLGYDISINIVKQQIDVILKNKDHYAFIALKGGNVVGYIHCFRTIRLTSAPFVEIVALIVSKSIRRKGIGKLLVQHAEKHTLNNQTIRVRCNEKRKVAHQFYLNLGYSEKKVQKVFEKGQPKEF